MPTPPKPPKPVLPSVIVSCHGKAIPRLRRFSISGRRVLIENYQCPTCKRLYFVDITLAK